VRDEERTPGNPGANNSGFGNSGVKHVEVKHVDEKLQKVVTNKTRNLMTSPKCHLQIRSRISSTSSTDEGISKTPKNSKNSKNAKISKNFQEKLTKTASIEPASVESAYSSFRDPKFSFEKTAFEKRLFKSPVTNNNKNIKSYDHWMSIQINDIILVEMSYNSLQKGKEAFNDFLDDCYDDDSVSKLVVYFNKTADTLRTTFLTMDFGVISGVKMSKMVGEQVLSGNCYMVCDCSVSTSDEDFSGDDVDLIEL